MIPVGQPLKGTTKGSGFGKISILDALKANEQVRTSAAAAK
ncbi:MULTISPECIES: hypothetical protein [Paenibacillus]|uniref:Uncharacterized protein n=1 Tax=Paenibacillus glycanilyticus TaxID=126569 RepID=A0ABQ6NUL8_9BACL|nr:hypothetical protein [Paenibacillus glycanilyticus]GMK48781.1 hypothetical protein PghCCS26_59110 [Paenibacillus glycanilyticus]